MISPENIRNIPALDPKKVKDISREALAKRLNIDEANLPDGKFFRIVDSQLDKLAGLDPAVKARELEAYLQKIDIAEAEDRARELGTDGKRLLTHQALEQSTSAMNLVTEKLKHEGLTHGKEAINAVGAIASASSMDDLTKGIDGLTKVFDSGGKAISTALSGLKDIFSSLWKMLGFDGLFKRIFGQNTSDSSDVPTKSEEEPTKSEEEPRNTVISKVNTVKETAKKWETSEGRKEIIGKASASLGEKISKTYFGGEKLSEPQMKKIYSILDSSLNTESIKKVAERLDKGEVNIGEMLDAIFDVGGTYPARVMWELSLSGIIPFWAISQHVVINPAGNLIKLTFDGLGFPVTSISLENFGAMLEKKAQDGDNHALDMARIQLYGVNSVLFRTIGTLLGGVAAGGIMLANTTTGVDGLKHLSKLSYLKEYDVLEKEFGKIEGILVRGSKYTGKLGAFSHMLDGIKDLRANSLVMDAVSRNTTNRKLNHQGIVDALDDLVAKNPELTKYINTHSLKASINNENSFRDAVKNLIRGSSSNSGALDAITRELVKYGGGRSGQALRYLEQIDSVKKWQQSLVGDIGLMSEKLKRLKLSYESLKLARSADTVILHMENMDDVSKFRAFLSTIPGGIRALSEVIPATSLVISLGSVVWNSRDEKDATTGESIMDVFKTALIPAYGTWGIIRDKTVNFGQMISSGEMPEFSDIALTGVVGGVFIYEVTRVVSGAVDIRNGNYMKGVSKLTYMHDIGRSIGQVSRGVSNIAALATKAASRPELARTIGAIASKTPKKGRLAAMALGLGALATGVAYAMGDDSPEDIRAKYQKDGLIDAEGRPTDMLKSVFYQKTSEERKLILDSLFILHEGSIADLPNTHYEEQTYTLVQYKRKSTIIDSKFRQSIQSLGIDIQFAE